MANLTEMNSNCKMSGYATPGAGEAARLSIGRETLLNFNKHNKSPQTSPRIL
jgi:hypothetical protein